MPVAKLAPARAFQPPHRRDYPGPTPAPGNRRPYLDDNSPAGSPALQLQAGRAIVQACAFNRSKLHVAVGSNVLSAILAANQAEGGFRVKNLAGKRLQPALNEQQGVDWTEPARRHP